MQLVYLYKPYINPNDGSLTGEFIKLKTTAIPVSGSRIIKSDDGVEIQEGGQRFIIGRRKIDTSWKVGWNGILFGVDGIVPAATPYKLVLICSVEEREIELFSPELNLLALHNNVLTLGENRLGLR